MLHKKPSKISILLSAINKVKNWYVLLLVYFGIYDKKFFILKLKNGLKLKLRTNSTDIYAFTNVWLIEEYRKEGFAIKSADNIIDVGAHIGLFTVYASQFCKNGKIFSYEPVKENFELLKENISLNVLNNVYIFNNAVSDDTGLIKIYLNEKDQAAHSSYHKSEKYIEANAVSIKDIIDMNKIENCDFLKLDCEGLEFKILDGVDDNYFNKIKKICMEYHILDNNFVVYKELKDRFRRLNYDITDVPSSNTMGILFAKKSQM